jgi:PTH1 family peptidyl-tRNA hydrolase
MYTIVGLGNPGGEYAKTRHNAGRILAEKLSQEGNIELKEKKKPDMQVGTGVLFEEKVRIVLPDTFMNKSGSAVTPFIKSVNAAKTLVVIYDDIDLPLGKVRVSFGSSSGGHNGIKSIERAVKTKNFIKVRVGVSKAGKKGAKKPTGEKATLDHLLGVFTKAELENIDSEIYERVAHALDTIFTTGDPVMGMNAVNGLPIL